MKIVMIPIYALSSTQNTLQQSNLIKYYVAEATLTAEGEIVGVHRYAATTCFIPVSPKPPLDVL